MKGLKEFFIEKLYRSKARSASPWLYGLAGVRHFLVSFRLSLFLALFGRTSLAHYSFELTGIGSRLIGCILHFDVQEENTPTSLDISAEISSLDVFSVSKIECGFKAPCCFMQILVD